MSDLIDLKSYPVKDVLGKLLKDKTTKKNIIFATNVYSNADGPIPETEEITLKWITHDGLGAIQPRVAKSLEEQTERTKNKAEVFTPSWICNEQNSLIDDEWFGRKNVFNIPDGKTWHTVNGKIVFPEGKDWKAYVKARRIEITCGEAPYLVSRYDTTTGEIIPIYERIGLFDRKMRIINENCDDKEWINWSLRAVKSIYGYDFQGDNVFIARENLLYDYIDYYKEKFGDVISKKLLNEVVNIITWNIWQMDGLKGVVPYSCHETVEEYSQISLFDTGDEKPKMKSCPGCEKGNIHLHNGTYCRIYDWTNFNKSVTFVEGIEEQKNG